MARTIDSAIANEDIPLFGSLLNVLYRFSGDGLNYHDFELTKVNDKVCVADIFIYTSGENLSKSMTDLMLMAKADGTTFNQKQVESLNRMKSLVVEGKYEEAKLIFNEMPETLKNHKFFQIYYLNLASGLGEENMKK